MSESRKRTWDQERIALILLEAIEVDDNIGQGIEKLTELLGSVRAETVGWTWTVACQHHAQGRDPQRQKMPELLVQAKADLNPDRE